MFLPVIWTRVPVSSAQSSNAAGGLPIIVPLATLGDPPGRIHVWRCRPRGLTRGQIYRARHRGSEGGAEVVVAEAEMLGVVPKCGYSVTVDVAHHEVGPTSAAART